MDQITLYTRRDYLAGNIAHDDYYAQFVNDETLRYIGRHFDSDELSLLTREDRHLNNIPLRVWDELCYTNSHRASGPFTARIPFNRGATVAAGESITRSVLVCIAKRAARQIASI